jgi:hypothetical protein
MSTSSQSSWDEPGARTWTATKLRGNRGILKADFHERFHAESLEPRKPR